MVKKRQGPEHLGLDASVVGGSFPSIVLSASPWQVGRLLGLIIAGLTAAYAAVVLVWYVTGHGRLLGLTELFDFDEEANIPTYFSALQLLAAAVLVVLIGITVRRRGLTQHRQWLALGGVLGLMSLDEAAQLHEKAMLLTKSLAWAPPALRNRAWVAVGIVIVLVVVVIFIPFVAKLPPVTRWGYIASGGLFVLGAVGLELVEGAWQEVHGTGLGLKVIVGVQELLEMAAIALFIVVTLRHARGVGVAVDLRLS